MAEELSLNKQIQKDMIYPGRTKIAVGATYDNNGVENRNPKEGSMLRELISWLTCIYIVNNQMKNLIILILILLFSNIFIIPEKQKTEIDRTIVQMDNWGGPWPNKTFFFKNTFSLSEVGEMKYGEDQKTYAKENRLIDKDFGLIENNSTEIPNWAAPYTSAFDTEYKTKLIDAFFKDDVEMQKLISELNN